MNKAKKIVGLTLAGVLTLTGFSGVVNNIQDIKVVQAASSSVTVEDYIDLITRSLKSNYLGIKNIAQWREYLKEARYLNEQLTSTYRKTRNAEILNKAEALMNAADRVNQVEKSMETNAHVMKNVQQWEYYITLAKEDLKKVDQYEFKYQHSELVKRAESREKEIENIKYNYYKLYDKVEEMYYDAVDVEDRNKEDALKEAKYVKSLAENLESHETKDFLIERIDKLIKNLNDYDTNYNTQSIYNRDDIDKLTNERYNKVVIDTSDSFYNKRISRLRVNTLEVKSGSRLILDNCEIGKLVVIDNDRKVEIMATGSTSIERTVLKSGAVLSNGNETVDPLKKPSYVNFYSVEVNTKKRVDINAPVNNVALEARYAQVEIGSYIDFVKLRGDDQNLIVSANGTVENLTINAVVSNSIIEGSGKVTRLVDNSRNSIILLKNKGNSENTTDTKDKDYEKSLEEAAEVAVKKVKDTREKEDKERAQRLIDKLKKGEKKTTLQKELDDIYV